MNGPSAIEASNGCAEEVAVEEKALFHVKGYLLCCLTHIQMTGMADQEKEERRSLRTTSPDHACLLLLHVVLPSVC
jgi:hypothetical protein